MFCAVKIYKTGDCWATGSTALHCTFASSFTWWTLRSTTTYRLYVYVHGGSTFSISTGQTQELESIQKRAIHIIGLFHFTRGMPYSHMLAATNLTSLSVVETTSRNFFSVLPILHPVYIISFPHPDLMQLHLGSDHTKFTQDRPPVQSDTVPSCSTAFLTTRTGLPTVNIHQSHFTHSGDSNY